MTVHAIIASRLHDGERFREETALVIEAGKIRALLAPGALPAGMPAERLQEGAILAPGFLDLQVNGGGGLMLNDSPDEATMAAIAAAHRRLGTTGLLPTLISGDRASMRALLESAAGIPGVLGLHLEGPFLAPGRRGIHPPAAIRPLLEPDLALLASAHPFPVLLTLAPECAPAGAIARLATAGVHVFAGHTDATAEQIAAARSEGLAGVTHLFNAMSQFGSRAPGVVGAALAGRVDHVGIIVDGLHAHPDSVRAAYAALGPRRLFLVSDAMATAGGECTSFTIGETVITLENGRLTGPDGTLGGAHLDMATAVRRAVRLVGIPLAQALRMATATPADCLGLATRGRLRPGCRADLVALDQRLEPIAVWLEGQTVD